MVSLPLGRDQDQNAARVAELSAGVTVSPEASAGEIAEAVGTTEGAARVHYHNAMRAVKEFLDE